jgi:nucleoid DNA-binding protein
MTKKEIVRRIAEEACLPAVQVKEAVQRTLDEIIHALVTVGWIELRDFGIFSVRRQEPRRARNPRTGGVVHVPARTVVAFKPGKAMIEQVRAPGCESDAQEVGKRSASDGARQASGSRT